MGSSGHEKKKMQEQTKSEETKAHDETETLEADALIQSEHQVEDALSSLKDELGNLQDRYLRLGAEFENYKKRSERDRQTSVKFANEAILTDLLPVLDHLEQAIMAAEKELKDNSNHAAVSLAKGVGMVLKQFEEVLGRYGVKAFSAKGQPFDPNFHEAMQQQESDTHPEGTVLEEYQRGYRLNDRLVRPARVVVAKAKS